MINLTCYIVQIVNLDGSEELKVFNGDESGYAVRYLRNINETSLAMTQGVLYWIRDSKAVVVEAYGPR